MTYAAGTGLFSSEKLVKEVDYLPNEAHEAALVAHMGARFRFRFLIMHGAFINNNKGAK